jgi:hypothetical protein
MSPHADKGLGRLAERVQSAAQAPGAGTALDDLHLLRLACQIADYEVSTAPASADVPPYDVATD